MRQYGKKAGGRFARRQWFFVAAALAIMAAAVIVLFGCGTFAHRHSVAPVQDAPSSQPAEPAAPASRPLPDLLSEIESYAPLEGVDSKVFNSLKDSLESELKNLHKDDNRVTSRAPVGNAGRVTDLKYDLGTNTLSWSYVNLGDYDLSGTVNVTDIIPVAVHYLANTTDGAGDDAFEAWIDGNKSGEVGISDITPIAIGYMNDVKEYQIVTSASPAGAFTAIGAPINFGTLKVFPKAWSVQLPAGALGYIAVEPVSADFSTGDMSNTATNPTWHIETVDSVGDVGEDTSIELDSNDQPHISYFGDFTLKYAYRDSFSWHISTVDSTGNTGYFTSIALDEKDHAHISYCDWGNYNLKYACWNGSSWDIATIDSAGDVGLDTCIALDSNDRPHISYYDMTNEDLKYAYINGSSWDISTVDSAGNVGAYTSIALDSLDRPHISYYDSTNSDLKYAYYNGSLWLIVTVDSKYDVGHWTSVDLDSNDRPHISYQDYSNGYLKYTKWNGSSWEIATIDRAGFEVNPLGWTLMPSI